MPEEHTILDVMAGEISPGVQGFLFITQLPDGRKWQHAVAAECLEWRAAEYGLTDPEEILDVVLHEPFQEPDPSVVSVLPPSVRDPSRTAVKAVRTTSDRHGPKMRYAESTKAARDAHRARIKAVKKERTRLVDPDGLLAHVHRDHGMDPERIRAKAREVDVARWTNLYGGLPVSSNPLLDEIQKKEQR